MTSIALVHSTVIRATLESGVLVEGLFVDTLLLFLLLLLHVVVDLFLLGVEDSETVFKCHISLQFMVLAEKLRVCLLTA